MREISEKAMEARIRMAAQLRFWMLRFNMDVKALAASSDELTEKQIYRWKNLEQSPTIDKVAELADAFKIPPCMLLMPLETN